MKIIAGFILSLLLVGVALAAFGVGISAPSKFQLGEVKPNRLYDVGKITVINTGDEYGCYKMNVAYYYQQPEKRVPKEWVIFSPAEMCLEPNQSQLVDVDLLIKPKYKLEKGLKGDYFSYLEACTYQGNMGACAGTKIYFSM